MSGSTQHEPTATVAGNVVTIDADIAWWDGQQDMEGFELLSGTYLTSKRQAASVDGHTPIIWRVPRGRYTLTALGYPADRMFPDRARAELTVSVGDAMPDRYWVNDDADGDWEGTNNWSTTSGGSGGAATPTGSDDVYFNAASSNDNCTLSANAVCNSLTIGTSGSLYTGTLDAATYDMTIGTGGLDCTYGDDATIDLGSGTWTCSGDWDVDGINVLVRGTSTVVMDTGGTTFWGTKRHYHLTVTANITIQGSVSWDWVGVDQTLTTSGTITVVNYVFFRNLVIQSGGDVTGSGTLTSGSAASIDLQSGGSYTGTGMTTYLRRGLTIETDGTFGSNWDITNYYVGDITIEFPSGQTTFTGNVEVDNDKAGTTVTVDNTNNGSLVLQGNFTINETVGTVVWTKGTGTITFSGTNNQTITTPASWTQVLDHITIDKSLVGVKLVNDLYANSLTVTDGDLDLNRYDLYCAGAFSVAAGARFYSFDGNFDDMQDGKIVLQNASLLTLTGSGVGTELSIYNLDFDAASGVTYAITYCDVQSSDGTGAGSPIDGSGTGNIDSGSNTGWTFTAVAVSRQLLLLGVGT